MIAYDELAAALERWRIRNGLPATPPLFADARGLAAPAPRATQAIASAPPPPVAAAPAPHRAPPPPPSGRPTLFGVAATGAPPPAAAAAAMELVPPPPDDDLDAEVLEADPYDNEGSDFAVAFGAEGPGAAPARAPDAGSSADGWPEANTVSTYGWGKPAPARPAEVDDSDEATHIGDATRHD